MYNTPGVANANPDGQHYEATEEVRCSYRRSLARASPLRGRAQGSQPLGADTEFQYSTTVLSNSTYSTLLYSTLLYSTSTFYFTHVAGVINSVSAPRGWEPCARSPHGAARVRGTTRLRTTNTGSKAFASTTHNSSLLSGSFWQCCSVTALALAPMSPPCVAEEPWSTPRKHRYYY